MARVILPGATIVLLAGLALMTYFVLAGTTVDDEGFVVEPFWAWGLGIWLVILSIGGYALWGLVKLLVGLVCAQFQVAMCLLAECLLRLGEEHVLAGVYVWGCVHENVLFGCVSRIVQLAHIVK